jgi:tripartite-type tricarboxylate transporter receptor subunit TctC
MRIFGIACIVFSQLFSAAMADDWPDRPIKLTVAYGAGGTTDSTARMLASFLEEDLGETVTVLNKPGGGGSVAATLAASQRPDGYNIFTFVTGAATITPHLQNVPYDPVTSFTPIARYAMWNLGVVVPTDAPYDTFEEFVDFAKKSPKKLTYSISGSGTPQHLTMERIAKTHGFEWKAIPYKGGAAAVTALLGNHVTAMAGATEWLPQVRSGDFKLLVIMTEKRMSEFPKVPTLMDLGYEIAAPSLLGIAAPNGVSQEIVEKLSASIEKATKQPKFLALLDKLAMQMAYLDAESFGDLVKREYEAQGLAVSQAGLAKK